MYRIDRQLQNLELEVGAPTPHPAPPAIHVKPRDPGGAPPQAFSHAAESENAR